MPTARRLVPPLLAVGLLVAACSNDITPTPTTGPMFTVLFAPPDGVDDMKSLVQVGGYVYATYGHVGGTAYGALAIYRIPGSASLDTVTLTPVTALQLDSSGGGLAAKDGILFVGTATQTYALNLASPSLPTVIDSVSLPPGPNGVRIDGDRLLLCDGNALSLWDVSNAADPVRTHAADADCWVGDVRGDRFAMGQRIAERFLVYDVSRPDTFTVFGGAVVPLAPARPIQVRLADDDLYVLLGNVGGVDSCTIDTYDLATLDEDSTAALIDSDPVGRNATTLEVATDRVIVADRFVVHVFRRNADGTLAEDFTVPFAVEQADSLPRTGTLTSRTAIVPGYDTGLMFAF